MFSEIWFEVRTRVVLDSAFNYGHGQLLLQKYNGMAKLSVTKWGVFCVVKSLFPKGEGEEGA